MGVPVMASIHEDIAVAAAVAGSYNSDSTLAWELPYAAGVAVKRKRKSKTDKGSE